jgi:hypothetical protein
MRTIIALAMILTPSVTSAQQLLLANIFTHGSNQHQTGDTITYRDLSAHSVPDQKHDPGCCAHAVRGQAAALPRSVTNARRRIGPPTLWAFRPREDIEFAGGPSAGAKTQFATRSLARGPVWSK